jgi:hypothetical protein
MSKNDMKVINTMQKKISYDILSDSHANETHLWPGKYCPKSSKKKKKKCKMYQLPSPNDHYIVFDF